MRLTVLRYEKRAAASRSRRAGAPKVTRRSGTPKVSRRSAPKAGRRVGAKLSAGQRTAKMTVNHNQIRRWAEARGGTPATVKNTARGKQAAGIIRIDFPGYSGAGSLKPITWEEFFKTFEARDLALIYQEKTASGKSSNFNKLVARKPGKASRS